MSKMHVQISWKEANNRHKEAKKIGLHAMWQTDFPPPPLPALRVWQYANEFSDPTVCVSRFAYNYGISILSM